MKYILMFFIAFLHLTASGQPGDLSRKRDVEKCTKQVYSITEFWQIADSLQLSIDELCDYPVISPIKKMQYISSGFGMRKHPIYKVVQFHTGIDIPQVKGTPVHATGNGVVIGKGYDSGYGYFLEIKHAGGFRTFYAHLSSTMVNVGDWISITQQIACVGDTGVATGSHLHYEVRKATRYLNPMGWCYLLFEILKKE